LIALYPRLAVHIKDVNRDSDHFQAEEEMADVLFEYGSFYFQASDYVFLPYRRFNQQTFLKKPSWLYFQDRSLDLAFNNFFTTGGMKNMAHENKGFDRL